MEAENITVGAINQFSSAVTPVALRITIAVLILLLGLILGKLIGNLIKVVLGEIRVDKRLREATSHRFPLEKLVSSFVSYIIYAAAIFISLNSLGLTALLLQIISVIIIIVIAGSFLLSVKDFFPNAFAGLRIFFGRKFSEGDYIQIKEVRGEITYLGLLETHIKSKDNEQIIIPNAIFNKRQVMIIRKAKNKEK